jgi:hypothetical protein
VVPATQTRAKAAHPPAPNPGGGPGRHAPNPTPPARATSRGAPSGRTPFPLPCGHPTTRPGASTSAGRALHPHPDTSDAIELAELLQFLAGWLTSDPSRLAASLLDYVGRPAYGTPQLQDDLHRFAFLLGGSDGGPLFGIGQQ